jgi:hypothetical protein
MASYGQDMHPSVETKCLLKQSHEIVTLRYAVAVQSRMKRPSLSFTGCIIQYLVLSSPFWRVLYIYIYIYIYI